LLRVCLIDDQVPMQHGMAKGVQAGQILMWNRLGICQSHGKVDLASQEPMSAQAESLSLVYCRHPDSSLTGDYRTTGSTMHAFNMILPIGSGTYTPE